ncbi:MAG: hypothetical protein V4546_05435 [Bacteroidota bacterium]
MDTNPFNIYLPKVVIGKLGVVFLIDAGQRALIQNGTFPPNIIELDKRPRFKGEHIMVYDWERHNHLDVPLKKAFKSDDRELILLPKKLTTLAQTPSDEECNQLNLESRDNGYGFFLANQVLNNRLTGKLPTIDMAGDTFYIDVRVGQLRHKDDLSAFISLDEIRPYEQDGKATFLYNPETRSVFHPDWHNTRLPEGVSAVQIPAIVHLDPVGLARYYGKADGYYLDRYVFQSELKVAIVPLEETVFSNYFDTGQDAGTNQLHPKR